MIATRVTMISSAASAGTAIFGGDPPVDDRAARKLTKLADQIPRADRLFMGPGESARQMAMALGLAGEVVEPLSDCDYGRWSGRTLAEVAATDPAGLSSWRKTPASNPHGGESLVDFMARVAAWMDKAGTGHTMAVAPTAVIRAAIVHALAAPLESFWHIDIEPLSQTLLTRSEGLWRLRAIKPFDG
jgi:broad specificity phosphatase PhoE